MQQVFLTDTNKITLDNFMQRIKNGDKDACNKWESYLESLAILISNLRMAYDMDIISVRDVRGIPADYIIPLI